MSNTFVVFLLLIVVVSGQRRIQPAEFQSGLESNLWPVIVDVRAAWEWDMGHIPGATFVANLASSDMNMQILDGCQQCNMVVYCNSGNRAEAAITRLQANGYTGELLNGLGTSQWTQAQYPLIDTPSVDPPPCASFTKTEMCPLPEDAPWTLVVQDAGTPKGQSPSPAPPSPSMPTMASNPTDAPTSAAFSFSLSYFWTILALLVVVAV